MSTESLTGLRVVLLHNYLTPYRIPLFTELARRFDFEVWILGDISAMREWSGRAPEGAFAHRMLPHRKALFGSRYNALVVNPGLTAELRRHRPDVLIVCGWDSPATFRAALHARRAGIPLALWAGSTPAERTWVRALTRPAVRWLVRQADAWLAYGSRSRDYLVSLGAREDRVFRAFNTVEIDAFARNSRLDDAARRAVREELGVGDDRVVLYCGNLLELKGIDELLAGFAAFAAQTRGVSLVLVGSGADGPRFQQRARELGLEGRVVFAGYKPRAELPRYYGAADLFVLPSRTEVWGLVINEALACGVPVIASNAAGAVADLMHDGVNGYVVPPRDPEALRDALTRYFALTNDDREAMREAARRSIAPFTIARAADAFEDAVRAARSRD